MAKIKVPITLTMEFEIDTERAVGQNKLRILKTAVADAFELWIEDHKSNEEYGLEHITDHIMEGSADDLDMDIFDTKLINYNFR
jgi:hypothetical protein